jgi:hypothetical protein
VFATTTEKPPPDRAVGQRLQYDRYPTSAISRSVANGERSSGERSRPQVPHLGHSPTPDGLAQLGGKELFPVCVTVGPPPPVAVILTAAWQAALASYSRHPVVSR